MEILQVKTDIVKASLGNKSFKSIHIKKDERVQWAKLPLKKVEKVQQIKLKRSRK